jgi:hypothetical protein
MIFVNIIFWWLVIVFFYILFFQKEKPIKYKQIVRNKQGKKILIRKIPLRW